MKKLLLSASLLISALGAQAQLAPGSIAPDFTVSAYQTWLSTAGMNNNGSYNLYDYLDAGYTVILDVSATWCGPCWNFHLTGALEDLYAAHGPAGFPGVNQGTTDDVMVFWIDASSSSTDATMMDGSGGIGNWIEPTTGNQIQYPMTNLASPAAFSNDYAIPYFPTVYKICQNRLVSEIGSVGATALYSSIASCPPPASAPVDAAALTYEGSLVHCQGSYTPSVKIQNNGLNPLATATVTITQNGSTVSTGNYSGSLATYGFATVNCSPITNFMGGALAVTITTANDANAANNTVNALVSAAQVAASQYVTVNITTDAYATETSWTIKNPAGTTVASGGGFGPNLTAAGQTVETPVNATLTPNTCYTFEILDTYGDGILGNYGNGGYSIVDAVGTVLASGGAFGASEKKIFKTGVAGLNEMETIALNVFPNPASDLVNISFEGQNTDYSISLMDIQGRVISSREIANASGEQVVSFSTENVAKGSYIVTVTSNEATTTKNVVIK